MTPSQSAPVCFKRTIHRRIDTALQNAGIVAEPGENLPQLRDLMTQALVWIAQPLLDCTEHAAGQFISSQPAGQASNLLVDTLCASFPSFAARFNTCVDSGAAALIEWLQRYRSAHHRLDRFTNGQALGQLSALELLSRESHHGGRRPLLMRFDCGTRIVYKPRGSQAERLTFDLLTLLRQRRPELVDQQTPDILDCGSFSWMAFVEHRPSAEHAKHLRYFQRMGGLLALAHVLGIGDLHHENVIAAGEYPVLVDLEVALQPKLPWSTPRMLAREASVLSTGLLPRRAPGTGAVGPNQSGISVCAAYSDQFPNASAANSPFQHPPQISAWPALCGALLAEFSAWHAALAAAGRDRAFCSWLERSCKGLALRVVLRETRQYAQFQRALEHASVLFGSHQPDEVLGRLALPLRQAPQLALAIDTERRNLIAGDVPAFATRADSTDLYSHDTLVAADFFPSTGYQRLKSRWSRLDARDCSLQSRLIAESLGQFAAPRPVGPYVSDPVALAESLGHWLLAHESDGFWFQTEYSARNGTICPVAIRDRLSDGRLGIALFFAALHAVGRPGWSAPAEQLFDAVASELQAGRIPTNLGAHEGLGGHMFAFCAAARILDQPLHLRTAAGLLDAVAGTVDSDQELDVYSGCAGALVACLDLAQSGVHHALEIAIRCRDHLMERSQRNPHGSGWPHPSTQPPRHLLGMAHGTHGIAMALGRMEARKPDRRTRALLADALAFESACFDSRSGRWPDLRKPSDATLQPNIEESWCNGATGIGLAYLDLARHVPQLADYLGWAQRAHAATLARLDCRSPCLCHGSLGNAWLLQRHQPRTGNYASVIAALLARVTDTIQREGVICGVQPNRAMPGLMSGVAGIGYGLLQLATSQPLPDPLGLRQVGR